MAISVDQFARHLVDSSLLPADAVSAVIDSLPADKKPQDGGPPALSTAQQEEARLEEFLREIVAPSRPHSAPPRQTSRPAAVAVAARTAPVADPDATLAVAAPQVATDRRTEQSLPGGGMVTPAARAIRRAPRAPWWQDRRKLAAAGAGGLLLVLLGVWVIVRDSGGKAVARVAVPEGGSVTVETAKENGQAQRRKSGDKSPQPRAGQAPPFAVAPFDGARTKEDQAGRAKRAILGTQPGTDRADPAQREHTGVGRWNIWPCPRGNPWNTCALNRSWQGVLLPPAKTWENPNVRAGSVAGIVVDSHGTFPFQEPNRVRHAVLGGMLRHM